MKLKLFLCGLLALVITGTIFAETSADGKFGALRNTTILIIRHAEKPASGYGLSVYGEARTKAYVDYFKNFQIDAQPMKLDYIFAAADSKASHRSRLTVEPTSKALGIPIDRRFKDKDFAALANEIRSQPHGSVILIAWHHGEIPALIRSLGADSDLVIPKAKWPENVFSWLIALRYDADGRLVEAKRINEHLLPGDANEDAE